MDSDLRICSIAVALMAQRCLLRPLQNLSKNNTTTNMQSFTKAITHGLHLFISLGSITGFLLYEEKHSPFCLIH